MNEKRRQDEQSTASERHRKNGENIRPTVREAEKKCSPDKERAVDEEDSDVPSAT